MLAITFLAWGHGQVVLGLFSNFFNRPVTGIVIGYILVIVGVLAAETLEQVSLLLLIYFKGIPRWWHSILSVHDAPSVCILQVSKTVAHLCFYILHLFGSCINYQCYDISIIWHCSTSWAPPSCWWLSASISRTYSLLSLELGGAHSFLLLVSEYDLFCYPPFLSLPPLMISSSIIWWHTVASRQV